MERVSRAERSTLGGTLYMQFPCLKVGGARDPEEFSNDSAAAESVTAAVLQPSVSRSSTFFFLPVRLALFLK